jgi:hypothetical protein
MEQSERFKEFTQLCKSKNDSFYKGVDQAVTIAELERAGRIASDAPTAPVRQDEGVIPHFKLFRAYSMRIPISADHEAVVAQAYAFLGQGLTPIFESEVQRVFGGSTANIVTVAPKSFQRMQNKLLNPADHGSANIPRPRCAKNTDVMRGCIIVKTVQELEAAYEKLQKAFKVVRVKNTHDPACDGWRGGYRSLLVNFILDSGVTWAQLFGDKVNFDFSDPYRLFALREETHINESDTHLGQLWLDHAKTIPGMRNLFALQGLQVIASEKPGEPVRMIAELQLVLDPYFEGRAVSHLLFKISRCDTGVMEMVRDFFQEYFHKEAQRDERLQAVRDIGLAVKEGRDVPKRVGVDSYGLASSHPVYQIGESMAGQKTGSGNDSYETEA